MAGKESDMGMKEINAAVLREVREVAKDKTICQKDIMEWSSGDIQTQAGETVYDLPELGVKCAVQNKDNRK